MKKYWKILIVVIGIILINNCEFESKPESKPEFEPESKPEFEPEFEPEYYAKFIIPTYNSNTKFTRLEMDEVPEIPINDAPPSSRPLSSNPTLSECIEKQDEINAYLHQYGTLIDTDIIVWEDGVTNVELPDDLTHIGSDEEMSMGSIFCFNNNVETIKLPENLKFIGYGAFWGSHYLYSIEIPPNVTTINAFAFCVTENLTYVTFNGVVERFDSFDGEGHYVKQSRLVDAYFEHGPGTYFWKLNGNANTFEDGQWYFGFFKDGVFYTEN